MSRYIDADKLIKEMHKTWDMQDLYLPVHFEGLVDKQPTADVTEVVRCENCKLHGHCLVEDTYNTSGIQDGYCRVGERKVQECAK